MASARAENEFKLLKVASTMKNMTSVTPKAHDNGDAVNFTARLPQPDFHSPPLISRYAY